MSIVVLGATGNLGQLVVEALLADGVPAADITAGGRKVETLASAKERGVNVAVVDYFKPETIAAAVEGADTVLLISGNDLEHRREHHAAVVDACVNAGVPRIAYTSVLDAQESPLALAPDHKATEELIMEKGVEYIFLRNGWYIENYVPTLQGAKETGVILGNADDGKIAAATRADFAAAAAKALQRKGTRVYELGGHPAFDYTELAAVATELLGKPVEYKNLTSEEHVRALEAAGMGGAAEFLVSVDQDIADGWLDTPSNDLEELLGRPSTSLKDGLAAAL